VILLKKIDIAFNRGDTFPGRRKIEESFHLNSDLLSIKEEFLSDIYNMKIII
jgi:hypothetical protein